MSTIFLCPEDRFVFLYLSYRFLLQAILFGIDRFSFVLIKILIWHENKIKFYKIDLCQTDGHYQISSIDWQFNTNRFYIEKVHNISKTHILPSVICTPFSHHISSNSFFCQNFRYYLNEILFHQFLKWHSLHLKANFILQLKALQSKILTLCTVTIGIDQFMLFRVSLVSCRFLFSLSQMVTFIDP